MLRLYVGEDRVAAEKAVKRALGASYEVFEGENLTPEDLPNVFMGTSLFGGLAGADGAGDFVEGADGERGGVGEGGGLCGEGGGDG